MIAPGAVARAHALAARVDDRPEGVHEGAAGLVVAERAEAAGHLLEIGAGPQPDLAGGAADRRARVAQRLRCEQRQHELGARQRGGPQDEVDVAPEPAAVDEHEPLGALGELEGELIATPPPGEGPANGPRSG